MEVVDLDEEEHPIEATTQVHLATLPLLHLLQVYDTPYPLFPPYEDLKVLLRVIAARIALEEGGLASHELPHAQNVQLATRIHLYL